jgi:hypothetical protein
MHGAFDEHDGFHRDTPERRKDVGISERRSERHLYDPIPVSQIYERQTAKVTAPVNPSTQTDGFPHVFVTQCSAPMGAHARRTHLFVRLRSGGRAGDPTIGPKRKKPK